MRLDYVIRGFRILRQNVSTFDSTAGGLHAALRMQRRQSGVEMRQTCFRHSTPTKACSRPHRPPTFCIELAPTANASMKDFHISSFRSISRERLSFKPNSLNTDAPRRPSHCITKQTAKLLLLHHRSYTAP